MARRPTDPYGNFRFRLEIDSIQVAGFSECTGLQMETKVFEYKEGGRNDTTLKFPEHTSYGNLTLKRGVTQADDYLRKWQRDIATSEFKMNSRSESTNRANAKTVAILLLDQRDNNTVVRRWSLVAALPVKWVGPDLKASSSEVAIESLEIAHEGIEVT